MSNTGWSPKPLKGLNLNGIFSHDDGGGEVKIEKANRWQQQRAQDGTPHTVTGPSVWSPPPAGPELTLDGLSKSSAGDSAPAKQAAQKKELDPEEVVKAYFDVVDALVKGDGSRAISTARKVVGAAVGGVSKIANKLSTASSKKPAPKTAAPKKPGSSNPAPTVSTSEEKSLSEDDDEDTVEK